MRREDWEKDWYKHLKICSMKCKDTPKQRDIFSVGWHVGQGL